MKLHEYQAREIFRAAGIPVPPGRLASTPDEAAEAARAFGARVVVKAQVHSGGRGKAGGVKLAGGPEEAAERARAILGLTIGGYRVDRVLVTPAAEIAAEFYAGIVLDRTVHSATVLVSEAGGVDIERVAEETPERIVRLYMNMPAAESPSKRPLRAARGLTAHQVEEVRAKVRCGSHSLGYSLFYGVWEFFYENVLFYF